MNIVWRERIVLHSMLASFSWFLFNCSQTLSTRCRPGHTRLDVASDPNDKTAALAGLVRAWPCWGVGHFLWVIAELRAELVSTSLAAIPDDDSSVSSALFCPSRELLDKLKATEQVLLKLDKVFPARAVCVLRMFALGEFERARVLLRELGPESLSEKLPQRGRDFFEVLKILERGAR